MKLFAIAMGLAGTLLAAPLPRNYAVEHYDARLSLDLTQQRLTGEVAIRFHSRIDSLSALELDAGKLEVSSVTEGGTPQYFERKGSLMIVALAKAAGTGEPRTVTIRYTAGPDKGLVFQAGQVYTSFFTSNWMVSNDRPDEPATLHLTIAAPDGVKIAASGRQTGKNEWQVETPAPPFLFAFAAGDFHESVIEKAGVKLRILGPADLPAPAIADATAKAMEFFATRTGTKYSAETYTQVFVEGNIGGQEAVGMTLLPSKERENTALLAHELAHQWYAVGIRCNDWSDFWLNEGLATYMSDAWLGQLYGKARFEREIENSHKIYEQLAADGKDRPLSFSEWQTPAQAGGQLPYHKGAWVLEQLRHQLGDEVFWRGIRRYTSENWGKAVTSDNFEQSMAAASKKDLTKFFERWVTGCCK